MTKPIVPEVAPPITTPGCEGSLVTVSIRSPAPASWALNATLVISTARASSCASPVAARLDAAAA